MFGTPKSLKEAIKYGIESAGSGGMDKSLDIIESHIVDYLSQKFTRSQLKANKENLEAIKLLWKEITKVA